MTAVCQNYGRVFLLSSPDPSKCNINGKGTEAAVVGEKSTANLQAVNFAGKPCEEPMKSLKCELVSEITGTRASCGVERRGQSQYEISYQPTIKGRHQLHVKLQGQHIRGSPLSLAAKSPVEMLGDPILTIDEIGRPWGVAVNQRGEVVVTDGNRHRHCVSVFTPSGEKLRSFGKRGSGQGEFDSPCGVAVDGEGNILVADEKNHRIQKFTAEGQFLASVGIRGSGPLEFSFPKGTAYNAKNRMVYMMDMGNNCVQVLNSDLTFSRTFGKNGRGKGQFDSPRGIACDSTGKVYVADMWNHRIQVFTADGKFLMMFGRFGDDRGELDRPVGVAIDASGTVYVSERGNSRVSVFTSGGHFVTSFGEGLGRPGGLAVDDNGVYVCYRNYSVVLF